MLFHREKREKRKELIDEDERDKQMYDLIKLYHDIERRIREEEDEEEYCMYFDYVMAYPPDSNPPSSDMPSLTPNFMV